MMGTDAWTPPGGAVETEPGFWETRNGRVYVDPATLEPTEGEVQRARVDAQVQAAQRTRQDAALVPGLIDRIHGLEMQVYLTEQFLEAALLMLAEKDERLAHLERVLEYEAWRDNQQFASEAQPIRHLRAA